MPDDEGGPDLECATFQSAIGPKSRQSICLLVRAWRRRIKKSLPPYPPVVIGRWALSDFPRHIHEESGNSPDRHTYLSSACHALGHREYANECNGSDLPLGMRALRGYRMGCLKVRLSLVFAPRGASSLSPASTSRNGAGRVSERLRLLAFWMPFQRGRARQCLHRVPVGCGSYSHSPASYRRHISRRTRRRTPCLNVSE